MLARRDGTVLVALTSGPVLQFTADGHYFGNLANIPATPLGAMTETSDGALWGGGIDGSVWRMQNIFAAPISHVTCISCPQACITGTPFPSRSVLVASLA